MTEAIIITDQQGPEFAAGVATAVAAQAAEEATEAQGQAEVAEHLAEAALSDAGRAESAAYAAELTAEAAHSRLDELEDRMLEGFGRISDALVVVAEPGSTVDVDAALTEDGDVTAPEPNGEPEPEPEPERERKPRREPQTRSNAFGNSWWFKGRK